MIDYAPIRVIELPLLTYHCEFVRTDVREKRTPRPSAAHVNYLRWWAERRIFREADRRGAGVAYTTPCVEIERRPDLRGTTYMVYIDAAFIPDRPGERLFVEEGRDRISIPVAPKGVHLD